jgi:hypothetical protein
MIADPIRIRKDTSSMPTAAANAGVPRTESSPAIKVVDATLKPASVPTIPVYAPPKLGISHIASVARQRGVQPMRATVTAPTTRRRSTPTIHIVFFLLQLAAPRSCARRAALPGVNQLTPARAQKHSLNPWGAPSNGEGDDDDR